MKFPAARNRSKSPLTDDQAREIYRRVTGGESAEVVARDFGVATSVAKNIVGGRNYFNATLKLRQERVAKELGD